MPLQKGKKRKRERRRGPSTGIAQTEAIETTQTGRTPNRGSRRTRWKPPPLVNAIFGVAMILVGVVFYVAIPQKGSSDTKLLFLILYLALGALYLGRAYLAYRRSQQS